MGCNTALLGQNMIIVPIQLLTFVDTTSFSYAGSQQSVFSLDPVSLYFDRVARSLARTLIELGGVE